MQGWLQVAPVSAPKPENPSCKKGKAVATSVEEEGGGELIPEAPPADDDVSLPPGGEEKEVATDASGRVDEATSYEEVTALEKAPVLHGTGGDPSDLPLGVPKFQQPREGPKSLPVLSIPVVVPPPKRRQSSVELVPYVFHFHKYSSFTPAHVSLSSSRTLLGRA